MAPLRALSIPLLTAAALVSGCNRGSAPGGADAGQATRSAAQPAAATPSASSPSLGTTNASTAAEGSDLSNSTAATGKSNVYQPASADNRTPGGAAAAPVAGNSATPTAGAASSNAQTTSSQTLGTNAPPNDGTLPGGTTGSTGSVRGGRQ